MFLKWSSEVAFLGNTASLFETRGHMDCDIKKPSQKGNLRCWTCQSWSLKPLDIIKVCSRLLQICARDVCVHLEKVRWKRKQTTWPSHDTNIPTPMGVDTIGEGDASLLLDMFTFVMCGKHNLSSPHFPWRVYVLGIILWYLYLGCHTIA